MKTNLSHDGQMTGDVCFTRRDLSHMCRMSHQSGATLWVQMTRRRDNWSVHVDLSLSCYPSTGRSCPALLLQAPGQGLELPPPHDIATQTSPLHVGVAESVQSADADYVVTTAAVATMVLPVKGIV